MMFQWNALHRGAGCRMKMRTKWSYSSHSPEAASRRRSNAQILIGFTLLSTRVLLASPPVTLGPRYLGKDSRIAASRKSGRVVVTPLVTRDSSPRGQMVSGQWLTKFHSSTPSLPLPRCGLVEDYAFDCVGPWNKHGGGGIRAKKCIPNQTYR